jgi:hypothetical protein
MIVQGDVRAERKIYDRSAKYGHFMAFPQIKGNLFGFRDLYAKM